MSSSEEPRSRTSGVLHDRRSPAGLPVPDRDNHAIQVDAWLAKIPTHPPERMIAALEQSLRDLWSRTETTLGVVTLSAVVERVLHDAAMRFPVFTAVVLTDAGVDVAELRNSVTAEDSQQLTEGMRYILIQLFTVVGNLTAEILTPALYATLAMVGREGSVPASPGALHLMDQRKVQEDTPMKIARGIPTIETGVRNLDRILGGGLPKGSVSIVAGPPGSGKTILAQQICFHSATRERPALYFNTLSEPTAKALLYMSQFGFFKPEMINSAIHLVDLGALMRSDGPDGATQSVLAHVKRVKPAFVVIDSFRTFDDFNQTGGDKRKFGYQIAISLMAWETTALLLGEYSPKDYETKPFFSIADGLITVEHREVSGEWQGFIQVHKMRGVKHSRDPHAFDIGDKGIETYTPRLTIRRTPEPEPAQETVPRMHTGITGLDTLLDGGIPHGSSVLLSGGPGTGKTVLLLDFIYQGAKAGQKGIIFSFEETPERLSAAARGLGWDLDKQIADGRVEVVFIPQPEIMLEADLLMMQERVQKLGAMRIAIDSVSVFLHKVHDKRIAQEKIFQVATIVQNAGAVGFFATDIPYGTDLLSRFGIEETIVDGVILLTATEDGFQRKRYLEVYKLRNTPHLMGRHDLVIGGSGRVAVFPRKADDATASPAATPSVGKNGDVVEKNRIGSNT